MKTFTRLWLTLALMFAAHGAHAVDAAAVNLAGEQRMLSQRIVKAWCQFNLNVQKDHSRAQLAESVRRFESNLAALEKSAASPEAATALAGLRAAWTPLRASLQGEVRVPDAAMLDARAEDVLMAAERLTRILQDKADAPVSRWTNLAGRQRMLSQRLVKIYMLRQMGVETPALREESEHIQNEFSGALAAMRVNASSPALKAELDKLALQWEWLHAVLATEGAESFRLIMAEGGEAVLQLADQVTRIYEQSAP
ncbi:MAG TPA: type IV pili methyl-accepting chemotaxis transducer N-terminal domain-containing protein [Noviherbaspirillum sp.]|nr:type IV pili methyl-accepting chemotaxis transducer N-terminal domain-containing protein [Noviherbaspirillum sp.]